VRPVARLFAYAAIGCLPLFVGTAAAEAQAIAKSDPRALAMGGAYVAVADGWAALQWNPAGLWVSGRREAALAVGSVPYEAGPWVESLRVSAGYSDALAAADAAATLVSPDAGLAGERTFGAYVVSKRFGGAVQQVTYVDEGARLRDDLLAIDMAALRTREFQFSAAHPFMQGRLVLGASAKVVQAQGRLGSLPLENATENDLSAGALLAAARDAPVVADQTVFSVDMGVLFMATAKVRIGGVVKNLNAPGLDSDPQGITRLPRQIRVGGLFLPHPALKLSLDFDLSSEIFVVGGRARREFAGGFEWDAGKFAMRGGMLLDVNAVEGRPGYTFGVGLNGDTLRADLGGMWSPDRDGFGWSAALAAEF